MFSLALLLILTLLALERFRVGRSIYDDFYDIPKDIAVAGGRREV